MVIKVLGSGCAKCGMLHDLVEKAVDRLGIDAEIVKVNDFADIAGYGVMATPALVIDEELKLSGRLPSLDDLVALIDRSK